MTLVLPWVVLLGGLAGAGVVLVIAGLRPAPPRLDAVLARLHGADEPGVPPYQPAGGGGGLVTVWQQLAAWLARSRLSIPHKDLTLIGMTPERFITEKVGTAAVGVVVPPAMVAVLAAGGIGFPWPAPTGASLALAALGFFLPDLTVRSAAERRRADFRHAVSAYLDMVRLAFGGGLGPSEALERAPRLSGGWAFTRINDAVQSARHSRIPPWEALARLGDQIGVDELADLADLADLAGNEGAKIADTISAYTQQMRTRRLADMRDQAGARTTSMTVPIACLGLAFIVLLGFPQVYLLLNS